MAKTIESLLSALTAYLLFVISYNYCKLSVMQSRPTWLRLSSHCYALTAYLLFVISYNYCELLVMQSRPTWLRLSSHCCALTAYLPFMISYNYCELLVMQSRPTWLRLSSHCYLHWHCHHHRHCDDWLIDNILFIHNKNIGIVCYLHKMEKYLSIQTFKNYTTQIKTL